MSFVWIFLVWSVIMKPSYRVPSMIEIEAVEPNGFNVVSTFSGCGGSCLGYRMAGFRVLWANEFVPNAQENYRLNHPGSILDTRDVRTVEAQEILEATGLKVGELDLFDGSPPCQAFSTAGKLDRGWGHEKKYDHGAKQCNERLFDDYIRLLRGLRPKVFIAENVSGLIKGKAKGFFLNILRDMKASGYVVEARLLDAQWLGVPQMRQRIIFVGIREDLGLKPTFPKPLKYRYTVQEAIRGITGLMVTATNERHTLAGRRPDEPVAEGAAPTITANMPAFSLIESGPIIIHDESGQRSRGDITCEPAPTVRSSRAGTMFIESANGFNGHAYQTTDKQAGTIQATRPLRVSTTGRNVTVVSPGEHSPSIQAGGIGGGNTSQYYVEGSRTDPATGASLELSDSILRIYDGENVFGAVNLCDPSKPCQTVQTVPHDTILKTERRKFTIAELRRICAFPDDFQLIGSYAKQWACLGNSVPPLMMRAIAIAVRDEILFEYPQR